MRLYSSFQDSLIVCKVVFNVVILTPALTLDSRARLSSSPIASRALNPTAARLHWLRNKRHVHAGTGRQAFQRHALIMGPSFSSLLLSCLLLHLHTTHASHVGSSHEDVHHRPKRSGNASGGYGEDGARRKDIQGLRKVSEISNYIFSPHPCEKSRDHTVLKIE